MIGLLVGEYAFIKYSRSKKELASSRQFLDVVGGLVLRFSFLLLVDRDLFFLGNQNSLVLLRDGLRVLVFRLVLA